MRAHRYTLLAGIVLLAAFASAIGLVTTQSKVTARGLRILTAVTPFAPCGPAVVTNSNDSGAGSLRDIIANACSGDTVTFDMTAGHVTTPVTLTSGELLIDKDLTITGPGANLLTISGNNNSRIFEIRPGKTVSISDLTIANGRVPSGNSSGAIYNNHATLTLANCVVSNNSADIAGGAISNDGGNGSASLTIINSTISGNSASSFGAGIFSGGFQGNATLNIVNSTISGNGQPSFGGGIYNSGGNGIANLNIVNSTIAGNQAASQGGGIFNEGNLGTALITLTNTIVSDNTGPNGPDIENAFGTVSGNQNIIETTTGYTISGSGNINADPLLEKDGLGNPFLKSNGGPTQTIQLLVGSPALDAGDNTAAINAGLTTDQRGSGFARIVDGPDPDITDTVDIGAFEAQVSVEDITDKATNVDTQLQFTFNVGGAASITSVTATSDNTTVIPNSSGNINVTGSGPTRTLTINPAAGQSGIALITVTVNGTNSQSMSDTFFVDVGVVAHTPSVTNATTDEDTQSTSGLVISRNAADGSGVTHFKITSITNGTLFKSDGATQINAGDFITFAEGNAGLKFTPAANLFSASTSFNFTVKASTTNDDSGLGRFAATATITVNPVADTPSVTNATTNEDTQSTSGLVISRNAVDGAEVTHFKISGITNGALFKNNGITQISNGELITFAEGNAGLKFTPAANIFSPGATFSFQVQGATNASGAGLSSGSTTATINVNSVADTPSVTNATTNEDTQTTTGLVISRSPSDGAEVTNFKITGISGGALFLNDGTSPINNGDFVSVAQGGAGLKFTPTPNSISNGSFQVQASQSNNNAGLGGALATATITVNPVADTPSVTNSMAPVNTQTSSGLVISRNAADGAEVTHFKITNIQNGTLFKSDGTTQITNNAFITFAEGNAGLKFTPANNLVSPGTSFSFQVQASLSNSDSGVSGGTATATIIVTCGPSIVSNSNDSGAGSLRATINSACIGSTITFDMSAGHVTSPITLTSGQLGINKSLTIQGPGANLLSISGNNSFRVFEVTAQTGASVNFSGLTITNGRAVGNVGGGIYVSQPANTRISSCVVSNNTATLGGGIANSGNGDFTSEYSTISNNSAGTGGGIYNDSGSLNLINSTIDSNSATTNNGGGIIHNTGAGNVVNSTITHNNAVSNGGGIMNNSLSASFKFRNSIVALNTANVGRDLNGSFLSNGHNLIGSSSGNGGFINGLNGDKVDVNARLATLANNGGPTQTVALLPGSPVLDAGDDCVTDPAHCGDSNIAQFTTDQRGPGFNRSADAASDTDSTANVDIGAFEAQVSVEDITDKSINEDGQLSILFSTTISASNITATSSNTTLAPNNPANISVSGSGTLRGLSVIPVANQSGTSTITVTVADNNGQTMTDTFVLTVNSVNDAPSFTKGPDQTVNEDSGAQLVNWATNLSAGPANESGQALSFQITNNTNAGLFSAGPAVSPTGTLTYTPAANANGSATIFLVVKDDGGTANGGVDTSAVQTFSITVNSVNDAPSFTKGANQTVNEDAGGQTVNNWATAISPGPADESGQTVTFQVTGNTNAALFSAGPAISSTGTLTYTPAGNANGSATITISLKDNGGIANGGVDTSASQTFTITVNSVNDVPSFTKGADQTVNNNAGVQTVPNWATNISAGPANESAQTLTFQLTNNSNPAIFSVAPAISPSGALTYTPAPNAVGTATITINLRDNGGTANGGVDTSASQSFDITVNPAAGFISFASANSNTTESSGSVTITVKRTVSLTQPAAVDYATSGDNGLPCSTAGGVATPKCDFTTALGTLTFAAGEDTKTITILISQDSFVEGAETFSLSLSNPTGGSVLGTPATTTITIADDATEPSANPIDDARNFVRQHYHDFLNREPDQSGWDFWTNQITSCGSDPGCNEVRRIDVSASFFLSIEFQQTGYLVERFYKVAFGDGTGTSTFGGQHQLPVPIVRANEFLTDTQRIGRGVVVLAPGWEQLLESNKQAYALEFVQTARFTAANAFPTTMTPIQFVDKLNQNAGNVLSASERTTAINLFGGAADTSNTTARAQAVRQVAEDTDLYSAESNRAFVLAEYFGYLRRNPNDAPESTLDYTGYDFWLTKLSQFNGNYINAEMVKAFLSSIEYRQRFGP
jgi:hypothetical protein